MSDERAGDKGTSKGVTPPGIAEQGAIAFGDSEHDVVTTGNPGLHSPQEQALEAR